VLGFLPKISRHDVFEVVGDVNEKQKNRRVHQQTQQRGPQKGEWV